MFFDAFGGVLVASRMYVLTSALLSCYERVFITKKNSIFHDFGILDLRTTEPFRLDSRTFFSNLRTFGLKNLRTREPSNLRTFGLIGCNQIKELVLGSGFKLSCLVGICNEITNRYPNHQPAQHRMRTAMLTPIERFLLISKCKKRGT